MTDVRCQTSDARKETLIKKIKLGVGYTYVRVLQIKKNSFQCIICAAVFNGK